MDFEEILANCLDALERGETIEGCLARYPKYRAELAPLLGLATSIRSVPQPRLSAKAFERGRSAVLAQARYQHALQARFTATSPKKRQPADRLPRPKSPLSVAQPHPFSALGLVQRTTGLFVSLVLLLCLVTLLRNVSISLPGAPLYPAKMVGEAVQGVLLTAAGEQIAWQAQQTENRLQELVALTQQGQTATPALLATIAADVQATLTASQRLPALERNEFLTHWVDRLQAIKKDQALPAIAALTIDRSIATVATATQMTVAPTLSPVIQATGVPPIPSSGISPTPILVPTPDLATATPLLVKEAAPPLEATAAQVDPQATRQDEIVKANPTSSFPTHAPEAPIVIDTTPTSAVVVVQAPPENSSEPDEQPNEHTHTAQSQPEPTIDPVVVAASTETANVATNNDANSISTTASRQITTSVDTAPETARSAPTEATAMFGVQKTATADAGTPGEPLGTETASASPGKTSDPTRMLTPVATPVRPDETPGTSATGQPVNTPLATSTASEANPATPTPSSGTTPSATRPAPTPTSKKTPTPEKTVAPTTRPTEAAPPTDTPAPASTNTPAQATPESPNSSTPAPTDTATDVSRKQRNKK